MSLPIFYSSVSFLPSVKRYDSAFYLFDLTGHFIPINFSIAQPLQTIIQSHGWCVEKSYLTEWVCWYYVMKEKIHISLFLSTSIFALFLVRVNFVIYSHWHALSCSIQLSWFSEYNKREREKCMVNVPHWMENKVDERRKKKQAHWISFKSSLYAGVPHNCKCWSIYRLSNCSKL